MTAKEKKQEIGQAYLPGGIKKISKIEKHFPNSIWSDVWDMNGTLYRNVDNKHIVLWKSNKN